MQKICSHNNNRFKHFPTRLPREHTTCRYSQSSMYCHVMKPEKLVCIHHIFYATMEEYYFKGKLYYNIQFNLADQTIE
jgi:hypothetical protein